VRPNVRAHCDVSVTLPLSGVESLNVSVAAALMIYEWARPRLAAAPRAEMRPSS
jgi:tRNA G18 (ribose-2'-O)-methylase SpoU